MMKFNSTSKKILSLLLVATMGVTIVGCGNKETKEETKTTTEQTESKFDESGAYKEKVTYTLGRMTTQNAKLPEGDTYEDNAYTRYVEKKLNAKIEDAFEANGDDYDRQVALAIASGDLPDIMRVGDRETLAELVENDLVADLSSVYDEYATDNLKAIYDSYGDRALNTAKFDGKLMALPATNVDSAPNQVWIRQDWLDQLGLDIDPDGNRMITIADLEKVAKAFLENDPGKSGNPVGIPFAPWLNTNDYGGSTFCMTGIANALGAYPELWLKDENGKVFYGSNTEETKEALTILNRWFKEGLLDPQFGTRDWDDITALLVNGQTGITTGVWHISDWLLNNVRAMDSKATFVTYVLEDANGKANVTHNNASNAFMVVRKDYANPELVIKIANIFYDELANSKTIAEDSPEVAKYQELGVDGTARPLNIEVNAYTSLLDDYSDIKKGVNGEIKIEEARTVESRNVINSVNKYLADPVNAEVSDWSKYHSRMVGIELIQKLTEEGSFNWTEPVFWGTTETMKLAWANLQKLEEEAFVKMIVGEMSVAEFDQYIADWNAQGGSTIIEEIEATIQ